MSPEMVERVAYQLRIRYDPAHPSMDDCARYALALAERDDLRRYRRSWDKELRDARDAARAAIDGRIAAEAEAERARGLLQRWLNDDAGESWEVYRALVDETQAHLASRPEGEVAGG